MTLNLTPRQIAEIASAAARAQLAVALERGECTPDNLDAIVRAIGNGAAQALLNVSAESLE